MKKIQTTVLLSAEHLELVKHCGDYGFRSQSQMMAAGLETLKKSLESPSRSDEALKQYIVEQIYVTLNSSAERLAEEVAPILSERFLQDVPILVDKCLERVTRLDVAGTLDEMSKLNTYVDDKQDTVETASDDA